MNKNVFLLLLLFCKSLSAQDSLKNIWNGFDYEASYTCDLLQNIQGGIIQGTGYAGMGKIGLVWNGVNANMLKGFEMYVLASPLHGSSPSANLIGDMQGVSNIDADGNHICFQEIWGSYTFPKGMFRAGLQDLNVAFAVTEHGAHFINGSFGIPSTIGDNVPSPLFPITSLGFMGEFSLSKKAKFRAAVFDGNPIDFDENPHNLVWNISKYDGALSIAEFEFQGQKQFLASYKLGVYYHSGLSDFDEVLQTYSSVFDSNSGVYGIVDQQIWKHVHKTKSISTFVQVALSQKNINNHYAYFGGGFVFEGIGKEHNIFGVGVAQAKFDGNSHSETVLETTYSYVINDYITVQPDIQYIINPAQSSNLSNSLVGILRFSIEI